MVKLALVIMLVTPAATLMHGLVTRSALLAPCTTFRCAAPRVQIDDPDENWMPSDEEMMAHQRAHFEQQMGEGDECVVSDAGTTCLNAMDTPDVPNDFAERPPIDDERHQRSPGMANNFYDLSNEDFRRPYGMASGSDAGGGWAASQSPPASRPDATYNYVPPPIDEERLARSPGIARNFWDMPQSEFKKPWGESSYAPSPQAPPPAKPAFRQPVAETGGMMASEVSNLHESNSRLEQALVDAMAREEALAQRLKALEDRLNGE